MHAELRLGAGIRVGRKRVERLMRQAGLEGIYRRRSRGCTRRDQSATASDDLVNRRFTVDRPDRLWVSDITEHPTEGGRVYLAVVLDAWSRRVVGWSIADPRRDCHGARYTSWRSVDRCVQMAIWRRRDALDNAAPSRTLQLELLDRQHWASRDELAAAIFEWIECFYNTQRRHSSVGMLSPIDYETTHAA